MTNTLLIVCIVVVVLACATVLMINKRQIEADLQRRAMENTKVVKGVVVPLRLQAYERMALFLERIELNQLVMRIHNVGLTVQQEQNLLLTAIRSEFEHNLSQQIYITNEVWNEICAAKEDTIALITEVAKTLDPNTPSLAYAEALLNAAAEKPTVDKAMQLLKSDIQRLF